MNKIIVLSAGCVLQTIGMLMACSISLHAQQADAVLVEEASRFDGEFAQVTHQGSAKKLHRSGLLVDDYADTHANGNIVVRRGNHYGVIAQDGQLIIPFAYEAIRFNDSYIRLQLGEHYGLADSIGNVLVAVEYADVRPLTEQVAAVSDGQHWALVAIPGGKLISDYTYDSMLYAPNPERLISIEDSGKWGLVDEQGGIRMEARYDRIFPQSNDRSQSDFFAWYGKIEGLGVCLADRHGSVLTDGYYERIGPAGADERTAVGYNGNTFSLLDLETKAVKATHVGILYGFIDSLSVVDQVGKFGVVDLDGRQILPFSYDNLGYVYDDYPADYGQTSELATRFHYPLSFKESQRVADSSSTMIRPKIQYIVAAKGEEVHAYDTGGRLRTVINYPVRGHMVFDGQFFLLVGADNLLGLSDLDGKLVIPIRFTDMVLTSEIFHRKWGYLPHAVYDEYLNVMIGDSVGVYHASGREVAETKWKNISWENEGFFRVLDHEGRSGLMNFEGQLVFPPLSQVRYNLVSGKRIVRTSADVDGNRSSVLLDETGKVLYSNPLWDYYGAVGMKAPIYEHGFLKVSGSGLNDLFVDTLGNEHRFVGYDYVGSFTKGVALVLRGSDMGFIDTAGEEIIPPGLQFYHNGAVASGSKTKAEGVLYESMLNQLVQEDPLMIFNNGAHTSLLSFQQGTVTCLATYHRITAATYGYDDRYYTVESEERLGLLDTAGRLIYPAEYDEIRVNLPEHLVELKRDGKYGLGDTNGTIIVPVGYSEMEMNSGLTMHKHFPVAVAEDGYWYFINEHGTKLPIKVSKLNER